MLMESVDYCMKVTKHLEQSYCIVTCDQAIYEIVLGLKAKYPEKYESLIIRMGGPHRTEFP